MIRTVFLSLLAIVCAGCHSMHKPGDPSPRSGDEIVVCGQFIHTGTRVITWLDPGGYDAYRVEKRFAPLDESSWTATTQAADNAIHSPNRYGIRDRPTTRRADEWDLAKLQEQIDLFVIHYDVSGLSRECFRTLQDERGLSVHFMIDIDGTIYQTLDVKERAYHATTSNNRSVGVELANVGAYSSPNAQRLQGWYASDAAGHPRIVIPSDLMNGDGGVRTRDFVGHPTRSTLISGEVQGEMLFQYDFTPQQYEALAHLTAALCRTFPRIACDVPRDSSGQVMNRKLDDETGFSGIVGHYHVQLNKVDPGPAMNWDALLSRTRELLR